jgi:hypothetical protein
MAFTLFLDLLKRADKKLFNTALLVAGISSTANVVTVLNAKRLGFLSLRNEITIFQVFLKVVFLRFKRSEDLLLRFTILDVLVLPLLSVGECTSRSTNCIDFNLHSFLSANSLFLLGVYINRNKLALNNDSKLLTFNMVDVVNKLVLGAKHALVFLKLLAFGSFLILHVAL